MRLLVYGGTLYAERRRIGEWPSSVSPQFLQSTAGLSELRSAYGVGVLDESPFVIFRMMLMHERRSYPFTVLLDPGERWADFGWNGARLLWLLFDRAADKGSVLIKEPESLQTAADLNNLLSQVLKEDAAPPEPEDEAAARDGEQFLNLWTGALTHEGPLVLGFGDAELGLAESPRDAEMARRLELLPLSLRGGLGWVMGGNEEYAAALGTKLILDNSRAAEANTDAEVRRLVGSGRVWLSDWSEVEARVGDPSVGEAKVGGPALQDESLAALFSKPLPAWEREQRSLFPAYTTRDLLEDISCIRRLLPPVAAEGAGDGEGAPPAPSEHLRDILEGRHRGPFNGTIEGLYEYLSSFSVRALDPDSTRHYLRKLYDGRGELEVEESRLDREAAIAFTVERGLYPSDGPVPESIRFDVLKRLLQREGKSEDIRRRLLSEWSWLTAEEGGELREVALERSAELPEGMSCWAPNLKKPASIEFASQVVWRHAGEGRAAWNRDYLLFGNDPGGARLLELHPGLVEGVVGKAVRALEDDDPGAAELRERARAWLVAAGRTELRRSLPIETKKYLADKRLENWDGLHYLKRAFQEPTGATGAADPEEQKYLASELRELSDHLTDGAGAPFLLDIIRLFDLARVIKSNVGMREGLDHLASLKLDPTGEAGESWVRGWREIASGEMFANTHGRRYWHKFREAAALYLAESDRVEPIVKLRELSEGVGEDPLKDLLSYLLFEGEGEKEKLYGRKLNAVRAEIVEKDETVRRALQAVLRQAVDEGRSLDGMFRRLAPYEKTLETIRQALPESQRAQLDGAEQKFRDSTLEDYKKQVFDLLSGRRGGPVNADEFSDLRKNLTAGSSNNTELFRKALSQAVMELLASPSYSAAFLGRFGDRAKTIKEIKDNLPIDATSQALDEAIAKYRKVKLSQDLEGLLCAGDGAGLSDRLAKEKKQEVLSAAADTAMVNCLNDNWKWGKVYDGLMAELTRDGMRRLRLSPKEAFVKFFGCLSPDVQQEVLRRAFYQHKDRFHQMVVRAYERQLKYDKAFKEKRQVEVNPLRDAVLAFLTEPEGRAGYTAKIKLIPSTRRNRDELDRYLKKFKKFLPAEAEANGQPAPELDYPAPAPDAPEQEPVPKQGWWGRLTQVIKPGGQS